MTKNYILLYAFILIGLISGNEIMAKISTEEISDPERCPIQNSHQSLDGSDFNCFLFDYGSRNGSKVASMVAHNEEIVVFANYKQAAKGLFFKFSGLPKSDTEKFLKEFDYVNDNWVGISSMPSGMKTAYTKSDQKVVLYRVSLKISDNCVGFSHGFGMSSKIDLGGKGSEKMLSFLVCELRKNKGLDFLKSVIEQLSVKVIR